MGLKEVRHVKRQLFCNRYYGITVTWGLNTQSVLDKYWLKIKVAVAQLERIQSLGLSNRPGSLCIVH